MTEWIKQYRSGKNQHKQPNQLRVAKNFRQLYFSADGREDSKTADIFIARDKNSFALQFLGDDSGAFRVIRHSGKSRNRGIVINCMWVIHSLGLSGGEITGREEDGMLVFDVPARETPNDQ